MTDAQETAPWLRAIRDHIAAENKSGESLLATLIELRRQFHAELAASAAPPLNAALRARDEGDIESRRDVCSWANAQLRVLGLAVRCPRTGQPSILVADVRDAGDDRGRFRLEHRDAGGSAARTLSSVDAPQLTLMADPPRMEPLAREHRGRPPAGPGR